MSRLYACIISGDARKDKEVLLSIAQKYSSGIEVLEDGILFDVKGLGKLIGGPRQISQKILAWLKLKNISGNVAVADTVDTAKLLARQNKDLNHTAAFPDTFRNVPLRDLQIEQDTLNVFSDLGVNKIEDLLQIPPEDLISRYGQEFTDVINVIRQDGGRFLVPNVKDNNAAWAFELDSPVENFEQLIFVLNHGLDRLLGQVSRNGFSTEQLDISFGLGNKTQKNYGVRTPFPTLDKTFWLKLVNLRISLDPPESEIVSVSIVSHFTRPRSAQKGLFAVSRPEPESLLLTVGKVKKLVGEENVGVPVLLDQRLAEAFALDADKLPSGKERVEFRSENSIIALSYLKPPVPAEIVVKGKNLLFIKTPHFSGKVKECSGVWKANSQWWDVSWNAHEWDIEIENKGIYRLGRAGEGWFLVGEYD